MEILICVLLHPCLQNLFRLDEPDQDFLVKVIRHSGAPVSSIWAA